LQPARLTIQTGDTADAGPRADNNKIQTYSAVVVDLNDCADALTVVAFFQPGCAMNFTKQRAVALKKICNENPLDSHSATNNRITQYLFYKVEFSPNFFSRDNS
jgi:hypothetical protein